MSPFWDTTISAPTLIVDGRGGSSTASVSEIGELAVGPIEYSQTKFVELGTVDTAFNFFPPLPGSQFVINGVIATGDLQISANAVAEVIVYEGASAETTTVDNIIIQFVITRLQSVSYLPLNILVTKGKFVNAKTDDDDVHMTILGYYIPEFS